MAGLAMKQEEVIRMARESGLEAYSILPHKEIDWDCLVDDLATFAALVAAAERERVMQIVQSMKADLEAKFENVYMEGAMAGAAAEREACADLCDQWNASHPEAIAAAIRARGQQ